MPCITGFRFLGPVWENTPELSESQAILSASLRAYKGAKVYTKVLNHKHFCLCVARRQVKRTFRVVVLVNPQDPSDYGILASMDTDREALTICRYYSARFQMEFTYRACLRECRQDGKQDTGLADCQARDADRLDFHSACALHVDKFNAALTTLNLAKAEQVTSQDTTEPFVFSMQSIKTRYFNEHYLHPCLHSRKQVFFLKLGLDPELIKKSPHYQWLWDYGAIAA